MDFLGEREDVGVSIRRLSRKRFHEHGFHLASKVEAGPCLVERDRRLGKELGEHLPGALGEVREGSCEEEVRDGGQGILVGGGCDEFTGEGFGRDIHERADKVSCTGEALVLTGVRCGRDAEIKQLRGAGHGIVHGVIGFEIPMDDSGVVGRLDGLADVQDDAGDFFASKGCMVLGVPLEKLAGGPLDDEVVEPVGYPGLDGANDVGVNDSLAELGFPIETGDGGLFQPQLVTKHLEGYLAVGRVLRAIDDGSTALADEGLERIAGDRSADKILLGHGAEPNGRR